MEGQQEVIVSGEQKQRPTKIPPPGPIGLPFIGNLLQLKKPMQISMQELAKKHGPIMSLRIGSIHAVILSSSEAVKELLKNDSSFADRPPFEVAKIYFYDLKNLGFHNYDPYWKDIKSLLVGHLVSVDTVKSFTVKREELAISMVDKITDNEGVAVDVRQRLFRFCCDILISHVFGKSFKEDEILVNNQSVHEVLEDLIMVGTVGLSGLPGDFMPFLKWVDPHGIKVKLRKIHECFDTILNIVLHEYYAKDTHATGNPTSLTEMMLQIQSQKDGVFTKEHVKGVLMDFFTGTLGTTPFTMEWAMSMLVNNPQCLSKLQEEIDTVVGSEEQVKEHHFPKLKYLHCVVKEILRLYPTAPLAAPHVCREHTRLDGYDVLKGTMLMINLWAIGRDGNAWDDADEFKPERFMAESEVDILGRVEKKMIPFGDGLRGCPGTNFALPILMMGIATLVQRFDWKVDGVLDMKVSDVGLFRANKLHAVPTARVSL